MKSNEPQALRDTLHYGTQYYRAPTPLPEDWEGDLAQVRAMNLQVVQLRVQWRWNEPREGQYRFDDIDRLFELARRNQLQVIVKFLLETAPEWIYHRYQGYRIDPSGQPIHPHANGAFYVGGWLPCFENPAVRTAASRFVRAVVERYRDRTGLLFWNLWNEPRCRPAGECACEHSNRRYVEWLRNRFGTVECLNERLGKAWDELEHVRPPVSARDHAEMFLWRRFMMETVAERLRWMRGLVREADPVRPVMTHVGCCSPIQDVLADSSDDWLNAREVDFYGSSLATEGIFSAQPFIGDLINDWIRAVSPYYWIHELYACRANWTPRPPPAELRFNVWTSVSRGARGICFWQYKNERFGNESDGYGLVRIDGSTTDRADEAARIGARLAARQDLFGKAVPQPAELALLHGHASDLASRIEQAARRPPLINYDRTGELDESYPYKRSLQGAYRAAWALDLPVDFLSSHDLGAISRYRAVYCPCPILLEERLAPLLQAYVEQGGILIAEASPALRQENTWVAPTVPGLGLDRLFGLRERYRVLPGADDLLVPADGALPMRMPAVVPESALSTAEPLARWQSNGEPAVTQNRLGKGRALLIQSYPGQTYHADPSPANLRFFAWLLHHHVGLQPALPLQGDRTGIVTRLLTVDTDLLVMLFNYNKTSRRLRLPDFTLREPADLAGDNTAQAGASGVEITLAPESVGAWLLRASTQPAD